MEEQFGNSTSPCSVGSKHSNLKKSFKMGIRSMLITCSKEDFLKAFSSFNKSKQDALYRLFIRVITSLHQSIEEHFESICLEAQVGTTLDTVEKLVEEQTLDILFNDETNLANVKQEVSRAKKDEIAFLTNMLEVEVEKNNCMKAHIDSLKKGTVDSLGTTDAVEKRKFHQLQPENSTSCGLPCRKPNEQILSGLNGQQPFVGWSLPNVNQCADFNKTSKRILQKQCSSHKSLKSSSFSVPSDALDLSSEPDKNVALIQESDDYLTIWSNNGVSKTQVPQTSNGSVRVSDEGLPIKQMTIDHTFMTTAGGSNTPAEKLSLIALSDKLIDQTKKPRPNKLPQRSIRLVNCTGDDLRKLTIPVGKRFQADIPKWNKALGYDYNLESSRWLGEKIWPNESGNITNIEMIGKGRSGSSCSCDSPGSIECVKSHIHDERFRLLSEIGDAFYSWGFDNMGEAVSESWTLKEQNNFNKLFKTRTLSYERFWRRAVKCLPMKRRESIVSFYFNVFVLRNVSRQARLPSPVIDSDDDNK